MTTEEHLSKIKEKCRELIATAEDFSCEFNMKDGDVGPFIHAACASTIGVINEVTQILEVIGEKANHPLHIRERDIALEMGNIILAAWPEEIL